MRIEQDTIGKVQINDSALWGPQTQRSLENFQIGRSLMPSEIIKAFGIQKKSALQANHSIGLISDQLASAMLLACDKIISGELIEHFPLSVWQTGSGTQTNMNVNEVIAGHANMSINGEISNYMPVHPNDHCNMHQSSNDTFPTVMHIATYDAYNKAINSIDNIVSTFHALSQKFASIIKTGRTHFMDATPVTFEQVFGSFAYQFNQIANRMRITCQALLELPQGGTAVGSGLNCHREFVPNFLKYLNKITGHEFYESQNKVALTASHDIFANIAGDFNAVATVMLKVFNDIKFMASGPRCGISEIILPANEPGSSIMPGKVNPTQMEAITMVATQLMAHAQGILIANTMGHCELNVYKPSIVFNALEGMHLLETGINNVIKKCLNAIAIHEDSVSQALNNSLMLITPLAMKIGYNQAAEVAKNAYNKNITLKQSCMELSYATEQEFDEIVDPQKMTSTYE